MQSETITLQIYNEKRKVAIKLANISAVEEWRFLHHENPQDCTRHIEVLGAMVYVRVGDTMLKYEVMDADRTLLQRFTEAIEGGG